MIPVSSMNQPKRWNVRDNIDDALTETNPNTNPYEPCENIDIVDVSLSSARVKEYWE